MSAKEFEPIEIDNEYISPIKIIAERFIEEQDKAIMNAVMNVGIEVNKEELIRALEYDRNTYQSGYISGYAKGYVEGVNLIVHCEHCKEYKPSKDLCCFWSTNVKPDDYCSQGERSESNASI